MESGRVYNLAAPVSRLRFARLFFTCSNLLTYKFTLFRSLGTACFALSSAHNVRVAKPAIPLYYTVFQIGASAEAKKTAC